MRSMSRLPLCLLLLWDLLDVALGECCLPPPFPPPLATLPPGGGICSPRANSAALWLHPAELAAPAGARSPSRGTSRAGNFPRPEPSCMPSPTRAFHIQEVPSPPPATCPTLARGRRTRKHLGAVQAGARVGVSGRRSAAFVTWQVWGRFPGGVCPRGGLPVCSQLSQRHVGSAWCVCTRAERAPTWDPVLAQPTPACIGEEE